MHVECTCLICGKLFTTRQSEINRGRGKFCSHTCYSSSRAKPTMPLANRFWLKVDRNGPIQPHCPELGPCWVWTAFRNREGYGRFKAVIDGRDRQLAHVVAYILTYGEPPFETPCVLHHCDNPPCCNPSHLFVGTNTDNNRDRHEKGRSNGPRGDANAARLHPERVARGERHGRSKLSDDAVRDIRRKHAEGTTTIRDIAIEAHLSETTIRRVLSGKLWTHVT